MKTNQSIALQLGVLVLSVFFCISVSNVFTIITFKTLGYSFISESDITPKAYIIAGFFNQVIGFIGGFFLYLKLTKQKFKGIIQLKSINISKVLMVVSLLIVSYPIVEILANFNEGLKNIIPNNSFILKSEETKLIQYKLLTNSSIELLIYKIILIGVVTGFAEELIFRGVLLTKIKEASNNKHYAVIISGLLFAAIHFQPLVILPMFFLGCVLGYLYTETKNLSYSILFHTLFNISTILIGYFTPDFMA
jgi:membrane protease YdiL (CAAX protease family)